MNLIIQGILALLRLKSDNKSTSLSPEELRSIVNESGKFIPSAHQEMLLSILDLEGSP